MRQLLFFLLLTASLSCSSPIEKEGQMVEVGGQLFVVHYQTHHVVSSEFVKPISVHDAINKRYRVSLDNGTSFVSGQDLGVGKEVTFKIYELSR